MRFQTYIPEIQGWKFLDFSMISDFFTLTILKMIFEISSLERVSHDNMLDPDYQKKSLYYVRHFSLNQTYIPA